MTSPKTPIILCLFLLLSCQQQTEIIKIIPSSDPALALLEKKMQRVSTQFQAHHSTGKQTHKDTIHKLASGEKAEIVVQLDAGENYFIYGNCGESCHDMDLSLSRDDAPSSILISHTEKDNTPILEFMPEKTADYRVNVKMEYCGVAQCFYGVQIFSADLAAEAQEALAAEESSPPSAP